MGRNIYLQNLIAALLTLLVATSLSHAQCGGDASVHQVLLEKVKHGIVKLETVGGPDEFCRSEGTGFILSVDQEGVLIATASHIWPDDPRCKAGVQLFARFPQSPTILVELKLVDKSAIDLALYRATSKDIKEAVGLSPLACQLLLGTHLSPIDQIVFFGYFPGDTKQALPYSGRIEDEPIKGAYKQRICGAIDKGTSGGPAFGSRGNVIGIIKERLERDIYGNPVVSKGWIIPADDARTAFSSHLGTTGASSKYCTDGGGYDFSKPAVAEAIMKLPKSIEVPYHLSEIRSDHDPLTLDDIRKWMASRIAGEPLEPIRYPKTYSQNFAAIDGYLFEGVSGVDVISRNRPSEAIPSIECKTKEDCIKFSPDRRSMNVVFRLWSGPKNIDETRGWIDMVIKTRQVKHQ